MFARARWIASTLFQPAFSAMRRPYTIERYAALDPLAATGEGIGGHDHEMTDFSPDGAAERAELDRATLRALDATELHTGAGADRDASRVRRVAARRPGPVL